MPQLSLVKTADAAGVQSPTVVGNPIDYTVTVTNTGNVTLSQVAVTDTVLGGAISYAWPGAPGVLAPGQSVAVTGTHAVTQADIEAGVVTNTASATSRDPGGAEVTAGPQSTTTPLDQAPSLALTKSASPALSTPPKPGGIVTFNFTITNTGNLGLSAVSITDRLPGLSTITYTWPGDPAVLPPGEDATATATYPITQADIDAGAVANTAVANGTTEGGANVPSNEADTSTPLDQAPAIALVKSADASGITEPAVAGQPIVYTFTVTNTGNTTLTSVSITDQLAGLPALVYTWPAADGVLLPGQEATATSTYAITVTDIDNGSVTNNATATGQPPTGDPIPSEPATTTTPLEQSSAITLEKSADASGITDPARVGQPIVYTFTVTNTGNTTLTGVTIVDELEGLPALVYTWPAADGVLLPGEQATATSTYAITAADITRGTVTNRATATGQPPTGDPIESDPATTTTDLVVAPEPTPTPTPPPNPSGLSTTGGAVPIVALVAAAALLIAGSLLASRRRRQRSESEHGDV